MIPRLASRLRRWLFRQPKPPNVVWICADDYTPAVSGTYGNSLARTPHLDRLAAGGIRFDRAYCACPLSTPSRMSFLTGRYPRSIGVTRTQTPLSPHEITIGRLLKRAGYETAAFGKTHYYDPLFREFDQCVGPSDHENFLRTLPPDRNDVWIQTLGPWRPFRDPAAVWLNAAGLPYCRDVEMPDTFFTAQAAQFLAAQRQKPFFLWLGFLVTHSPFRFPIEFQKQFDPACFSIPDIGPADAARIPPVFRDLTKQEKQGIIAAYYTSVAYMDRNVGWILDALQHAGYADDTLVVFNSDHGYLLGEHGRFEKHCCYEEAVRTALLLRLPQLITPGSSSSALIELIDLVPTILDLCGVRPPSNLQGQSFGPLLRGTTSHHREHVISEYPQNAEAMVRTDRWKLMHFAGTRVRRDGYATELEPAGPSTRLYDLAQDPREWHDVAHLPENQEMVDQLLQILATHAQTTARPGTLPDTRNPLPLLAKALLPVDDHNPQIE